MKVGREALVHSTSTPPSLSLHPSRIRNNDDVEINDQENTSHLFCLTHSLLESLSLMAFDDFFIDRLVNSAKRIDQRRTDSFHFLLFIRSCSSYACVCVSVMRLSLVSFRVSMFVYLSTIAFCNAYNTTRHKTNRERSKNCERSNRRTTGKGTVQPVERLPSNRTARRHLSTRATRFPRS